MKRTTIKRIIIIVSILFACWCLTQVYVSWYWAIGVGAGCVVAIFLDDTIYQEDDNNDYS